MSLLRSDDQKATTQSVSLSSAGIRALIYQISAIYLRTPIKLFKPSRFDYMVYVREQANRHFGLPSKPYKFYTHSSLAMLINVTKREGWRFIPDHLLPPLLANSATGFILYGTYLTTLNVLDQRRHATSVPRVSHEGHRTVRESNLNGRAQEESCELGDQKGSCGPEDQKEDGVVHKDQRSRLHEDRRKEQLHENTHAHKLLQQENALYEEKLRQDDLLQEDSHNNGSEDKKQMYPSSEATAPKEQFQQDSHCSDRPQSGEKTQPEFKVKGYSAVDTWKAGFIAGAVQSLVAAPIDAIYSRLSTAELLSGKHENLWKYGAHKLKEIGLVGVFAGYAFSLVKESFGFAFYFSTFEVVKTEGYNVTYRVISAFRNFTSAVREKFVYFSGAAAPKVNPEMVRLEQARLTRVLRYTFILLAGASAALTLLSVQYPLLKLQKTHLHRLEALDIYNLSKPPAHSRPFIKLYYNSYLDTLHYVQNMRRKSQLSWMQLAYKGFGRNALTTIPATSVGLLVFEIMRTRVADSVDVLEF